MRFAILSTRRDGVTSAQALERLAARPEAHTAALEAEYLLLTRDPEVVTIINTDDDDLLLDWALYWDDLYVQTAVPVASTADLPD